MVRLVVGIFICMYAGLIVNTAVAHLISGKAEWRLLLASTGGLACLATSFLLLCRGPIVSEGFSRIGVGIGSFYAAMMLGMWLQQLAGRSSPSVLNMVITSLSLQTAAIVLVGLLLREHGTRWTEAFGLRTGPGRALLYGFMVAGFALPIGWLVQHGLVEVMRHIPGIKPEEQEAVQTLRMANTLVQRLALGMITIVLAPVSEELLFRGVLYPWIRQFGFRRLAVWITAVVFAGMHFNLASFVPLALFSVALTWLYDNRGNLLACIAAHATFNAMNFSLLLVMEHMEQTAPLK